MEKKVSNVAKREPGTPYFGGTYRDAPGRRSVACQISIRGVQHRKQVKTVAEAKRWLESMSKETEPIELTKTQIVEAHAAFRLVAQRGKGRSLLDCVEFGLGMASADEEMLAASQAVEHFLDAIKGQLSPLTYNEYRVHLSKFAANVGTKTVIQISKADVVSYLNGLKNKPYYYNHAARSIKRFFNWLLDTEQIPANPAERVKLAKTAEPRRRYLSVDQTRRLLAGTAKMHRELIPYVTLGLFSGIRPAEIMRLVEGDINLETGYIHVYSDISKTRCKRIVSIMPCLSEWLSVFPVKDKVTHLTPSPIAKRMRLIDLKYDVGLSPDVLRHSYATYKTALAQDSASVALEMGHSEAIAKRHYRGIVTKEAAEEYFGLTPQSIVDWNRKEGGGVPILTPAEEKDQAEMAEWHALGRSIKQDLAERLRAELMEQAHDFDEYDEDGVSVFDPPLDADPKDGTPAGLKAEPRLARRGGLRPQRLGIPPVRDSGSPPSSSGSSP